MLSAPPIIPATRHGIFRCTFTPHRRASRICSPARFARPPRRPEPSPGPGRPRHEIGVVKRRVDLCQIV